MNAINTNTVKNNFKICSYINYFLLCACVYVYRFYRTELSVQISTFNQAYSYLGNTSVLYNLVVFTLSSL